MCAYADLDNSFLALKKSSPKTEIKVYPELRFSLRSILLDFQSFTEKPVFESAFAHPMFFFIVFGYKQYGLCLCDMQIGYEMISNAHVRLLTVPILVARGRVPFGQHQESRPLARSNDIPVLNGFVITID